MKWSNWLDEEIWEQIFSLLLNDAFFKLTGRARELTGKFNGVIASLVGTGYVTFQTVGIRRLCDKRKDVISLRRLLIDAKATCDDPVNKIEQLLRKLDNCDRICDLVNDHIAHTANPVLRPDVSDWKLQASDLTDAHKVICQVATAFDRNILRRRNYVKVLPVPQYNIMEDFQLWMSGDDIKKLWEFWHAHNASVNAWIAAKN